MSTKLTVSRLALLALRPRDEALLDMVLSRFMPGQFAIVQGAAEVVIVDLDSPDSRQVLARWRQQFGQTPVIALTLDRLDPADSFLAITKPIDMQVLVDILTEQRRTLARPVQKPPETGLPETPRPRFSVTPPPTSLTARILSAAAGVKPTLDMPDATPPTKPVAPSPAPMLVTAIPPRQAAATPPALAAAAPAKPVAVPIAVPTAPLAEAGNTAPLLAPLLAPIAAAPPPISNAPLVLATALPASAPTAAPTKPAVPEVRVAAATGQATPPSDDSEYCGKQGDIPPADCLPAHRLTPQVAAERFFDPEQHLLGLLQTALRQARVRRQAMHIMGLKEPILVTPDDPPRMICPIQDATLLRLCSSTQELELKPASSRLAEEAQDSFDALRWKVALWTARGRLPRNLDPQLPVKLKAWPNLSRLTPIPHAMRITTLLSKSPVSPLDVAGKLHIPQRYVFSLVSAAAALGLIEAGAETLPASAPTAAAPEVTPAATKARRGLFQRILSSLTHAA